MRTIEGLENALPPSRLGAGAAVGPYILEEEVGRGGMGTVWRAHRGDGVLKRQVALKLPHAGPSGPELAARFARERDILAQLAHPHIARLYDAGFDTNGEPFLALEYVPGEPLIRHCDQQRLDVRRRLELFKQVLQRCSTHTHISSSIATSSRCESARCGTPAASLTMPTSST